MKKRLVIDAPIDQETTQRLQAWPELDVVFLTPRTTARTMPPELLGGVHGLMCRHAPTNFEALTDLDWVQLTSVGFEHWKPARPWERPIRVTNARGIFDTAIGEWNLAMMINLTRDLRDMVRWQDNKTWKRHARFAQEIRGKTLGLWGYGGIGRETARLAKAFGVTVHVLTRHGIRPRGLTFALPGTGDPEGVLPDHVFTAGQEEEFLRGLDFLVLALPLTRGSTGRVGVSEFKTLKPSAFVLNPARGPIIQEQALLTALRESWIAGAAIDTHYVYPLPPEHPLWGFPNVILTPHISGSDHSTLFPERLGALLWQNLERFLNGQPMLNELTRAEWLET